MEVGAKRRRKNRALRDGNPPPAPAPRYNDDQEEDAIPIYRTAWETLFGGVFASFDDESNKLHSCSDALHIRTSTRKRCPMQYLACLSIRISKLKHGLGWPLHVYGLVAARDSADHNRNYLFRRTRDNCQTLTKVVSMHGSSSAANRPVPCDPASRSCHVRSSAKSEGQQDRIPRRSAGWLSKSSISTKAIQVSVLSLASAARSSSRSRRCSLRWRPPSLASGLSTGHGRMVTWDRFSPAPVVSRTRGRCCLTARTGRCASAKTVCLRCRGASSPRSLAGGIIS